jgi:hypothetical protein
MNEKVKFNANTGPRRWGTSHGIGRGGIGSDMSSMGGYNMTRSDGKAATASSMDSFQIKSDKSVAADPMSYSMQTTTIPEQASKESNFIGSAWFYNLSINQVRISYLVFDALHF